MRAAVLGHGSIEEMAHSHSLGLPYSPTVQNLNKITQNKQEN